jgi:hypothetical protein
MLDGARAIGRGELHVGCNQDLASPTPEHASNDNGQRIGSLSGKAREKHASVGDAKGCTQDLSDSSSV